MARKGQTAGPSGHTILLVDDNAEYLEAARMLLEGEGHDVACARTGSEALDVVKSRTFDVMLLDYFMPGMTGEEVVRQLRTFNPLIQVILQTGYASEQPPREMLKRLDIQGYYDKSEGPDKLLLWTDVGLRAAYDIQMLAKSRQGLQYILEVTPELHRIKPLQDLLQGILLQVSGLLGAYDAFLAVLRQVSDSPSLDTDSILAMYDTDSQLVIKASTGRFSGSRPLENELDPQGLSAVLTVLKEGRPQQQDGSTIIPLTVGERILGVIYVDRPAVAPEDAELLEVFANQAAVAIHNIELYELATMDGLTGVYTRGFFERWLMRELRTAFRAGYSLSLMMVDIDHMKEINDTWGHVSGDKALVALGRVLRQAARHSDVVGRYGGDEFALLLAHTTAQEAEVLGQRILEQLAEVPAADLEGPSSVGCSVGACELRPGDFSFPAQRSPVPQAYFETMAQALIRKADEVMYQAKSQGGRGYGGGDPLQWQNPWQQEEEPA